jgi:hypothetical protein
LVRDARLPGDQIGMLSEIAEVEHNIVLRPVLRNSDVPGSDRFLGPETWRKQQKSYAPRCYRTVRTIRLHIYLQLQLVLTYCSRF